MKTSDLIGPALHWAVANIEGVRIETSTERGYLVNLCEPITFWFNVDDIWDPSTDWSQGGPIIEREFIDVDFDEDEHQRWEAFFSRYSEAYPGGVMCHGPTPLIAAMRCFVASKLGDEVDVPKEIL